MSVTYQLDEGDASRIRWMLLDTIKAKSQLDQMKAAVGQIAKGESSVDELKVILHVPVDLDIIEVADTVQLLSVLSVVASDQEEPA